jgi:hypothetical protein
MLASFTVAQMLSTLTMIGTNGMRHSKFPRRSDMVAIKLKHVVDDKDRHGNIRHYFRRKGLSLFPSPTCIWCNAGVVLDQFLLLNSMSMATSVSP